MYTTAANERLRSVFETERQTFPIESAGHVGLTPLRKPLFKYSVRVNVRNVASFPAPQRESNEKKTFY
ncbi:hypothetical protein PCANC_12852 [Puccinia coronata f. sp. avenae]|uniref:Uncharacterized protein n=1 Tax=Puccinia coronata f. sp. avenae TaxID=200324 RepID=A0A2N5SPM4_9BASI|nr:hypothetical protein PCANC_12852 [Puccinia coronata f. sp. avenae]